MAAELAELGALVDAGADFIKVTPRKLNAGVAVDTYDDHRMAMSLSLAALGGVRLRINDPECVGKTFPDYFKVFAGITQ
jgi:3-phosphoshikimate 1-carboxyvinyltransferase